jgi:Domain of unknown function (DUF4160)
MPRVSLFYGISIYFYYNDHVPPHFHAKYAGDEALFSIESLQILSGRVSRRVRALVVEWATLHHDELVANWDLARQGVALQAIDPLE